MLLCANPIEPGMGEALRAKLDALRSMTLDEIKKPEESRYPWDYYKVLSTIPGDEAFRPLSKSSYKLVKTS